MANTPIPSMIKGLFDKPVTQATVIDKEEIEKEILAFLS
jgi:threonine synthase